MSGTDASVLDIISVVEVRLTAVVDVVGSRNLNDAQPDDLYRRKRHVDGGYRVGADYNRVSFLRTPSFTLDDRIRLIDHSTHPDAI